LAGGCFGQYVYLRFVRLHPPRLTIVVQAGVPRDGKDPRQNWFAPPIGVPRLMHSHPGILQKIVGIFSAEGLYQKEAEQ
jgi:hypothetical protein